MEDDEINTEYIKKRSSFVLDDVFQSTEEMNEKLEKFQKDLFEECDDIEERIFVQNIISFLQWRLKERENAFESVNIVENLQNKPHLITHCNKILFYKESGEHFLSNKLSEDLKNNDHFRKFRTISEATAEIGYCYSRLGPKYHDRAVKLLKEAIANITPERNLLWEYRLALTLRRQTHIFQITKSKLFKPDETKEEAAQLLNEILKFKTNDTRSIRIKAKACCDLGTLLFRRENLFKIIHTDKEETEKITESWCFEKAMRLCPNQYFVLQHYGRHLRYAQDLEKSKDMLERAMQLKDTLFSRHHLALTLKRMVEITNPKPGFGNKSQYPFSMNDGDQSKYDSYDCNESSMSKEIDSLSIDPGQKVDNPVQDKSDQFKSSLTTTLYDRSKSTDFVNTNRCCLKRGDTLAFENRSTVPKFVNVCESHFNVQSPTTAPKKNQSMFHQKREQTKHFHNQAGAIDHKGIFIATKKSPRYVCISPDNPLLLEAVEHLKRAIEMSKEFDGTRYDLGLIYRMLDRSHDALKCFSFITSSNCGNPSEYSMYVINAYEQQSFCKLDLLAKETDLEKKKELRYDTKECAWKALTIVSGMIGAIPILKITNQCFPTLKILLQHEDNSLRTLKELAKLHVLLDYDEESIEYYREMIKKKWDKTIVIELAQTYIKIKDFRNAIYTLSLLQRRLDVNISDKSLYVDTCIKGAEHLLIADDDLEMAKIWFSEAYKAIFSRQNKSTTRNEAEEIVHDILVLHSCGEEKCCYQRFITSTLNEFVRLKFAENDDDCLGSHRKPDYLEIVMCRSQCIFIIQHERMNCAGDTDKYLDQAIEYAYVYHKAKTLLIRKQEVEQYAPGCKEIVLTCGPGDIDNSDTGSRQYLLKVNLFSNMLDKLSEMFLRKSVDL